MVTLLKALMPACFVAWMLEQLDEEETNRVGGPFPCLAEPDFSWLRIQAKVTVRVEPSHR